MRTFFRAHFEQCSHVFKYFFVFSNLFHLYYTFFGYFCLNFSFLGDKMTGIPAPVFTLNPTLAEKSGLVGCVQFIVEKYDLNGQSMFKVFFFSFLVMIIDHCFQFAFSPNVFVDYNVETNADVRNHSFIPRDFRRDVGNGVYQHEYSHRAQICRDIVKDYLCHPEQLTHHVFSETVDSLLDRSVMANNQEMQFTLNSSLLQTATDAEQIPSWANLNALRGVVADLKNEFDVPGVTQSQLVFGQYNSVSPLQTGLLEMAQITFLMPHSHPKVRFLRSSNF